jgi:hypothetical protein
LLEAAESFGPAYCAPAKLAEPAPLLSPNLAERRAAVEAEAQTIRTMLGERLYKYPPVIDGRHSVELAQWHYRSAELANEIAYFYMYKEAEVGRDPWRIINATDHEKSDCYGIVLCGDQKNSPSDMRKLKSTLARRRTVCSWPRERIESFCVLLLRELTKVAPIF